MIFKIIFKRIPFRGFIPLFLFFRDSQQRAVAFSPSDIPNPNTSMLYHPILRFLTVPLCVALVAGCNDKPTSFSTERPSQRDTWNEAVKANQQSRQWQQQFEAEHTLRVQTETQLNHQTAAKSWWQTAATLLAIAAVILLGLGAILGSAARHESQKS